MTSTRTVSPRGRTLGLVVLVACLSVAAGPVSGAGQEPDYEALYAQGHSFAEFLAAADRRRAAWLANYENGAPDPEQVERAAALGPGLRLLVVAEDWCGDSVNTIPYLARLIDEVPGIGLRVVDSEVGAAVMEHHRTPDDRGATPTVIVLDANGNEAGAWVERPGSLQEWFLATEGTIARRALFDQKYEWYDDDAGRTTVAEIVELLARAATPEARTGIRDLPSGTTALLQSIHPVDENVVWASGHDGTWVRSLDGGASWIVGSVDGAPALQFRDVHAIDADTAWLLSAGNGEASRIYRTDDGGASWTLQFLNRDEAAFFDCFAFWDAHTGIAFSDAVDGRFAILRTTDGGGSWDRLPPAAVPPALPGEGSFAASGTCAITAPDGRGWIGTGAAERARVLASTDHGATWSVADTPLTAHASAGIASLVWTGATLLALGGDISTPTTPVPAVAASDDGGVNWELGGLASGAVYGAAPVPGTGVIVAVGPAGIDRSDDLGRTWHRLDPRSHWAVAFASATRGWAVGPEGRITHIDLTAAPLPEAP